MLRIIRNLVKSGNGSLFDRVASAGFWAMVLRVGIRGMQLVRTVILARLLAPEDFGLAAIATLAILLVEQLSTTGFDDALVQKQDDIRPYLDTAWTLQVARGVAMTSVLFLGAPYIATFFSAPEAEAIVRALSLAVLARSLANIGVVYFVKDLRFDLKFRVEIAERTTDAVVSIVAAVILRSVWALVLGVIAGAIVRLIASYWVHPYRPRFRWVGERARNLFGFGKWILLQRILQYAVANLDDVLVGRILGVASLGLYRMAFTFSQAVASEFTHVANAVAFPTYSVLQNEPARLKRAYLGAVHFSAFIGFPLAIGTILVAPDLVIGVLGDAWEPMLTTLQLLSVAGLIRALTATTGAFFQGVGRPQIPAMYAAVHVAVMAGLLWPAITEFGLNGAAGTVVFANMLGLAAFVQALYAIRAGFSDIMQALLYPILNTMIMIGAVVVVGSALPNRPSLLSLLVLIGVGVVVYFVAVAVSVKYLGYRAPKEALDRIRSNPG